MNSFTAPVVTLSHLDGGEWEKIGGTLKMQLFYFFCSPDTLTFDADNATKNHKGSGVG